MELWRQIWRQAIAPKLSLKHLECLRLAMLNNDHRLIQEATTKPPPLLCTQDMPVEAACLLCYGDWQAEELQTVGEVEERFAMFCFDIDQTIGEPAACRWFINWFDENPRDEVFRELLPEISRSILEKSNDEEEDHCQGSQAEGSQAEEAEARFPV